MKPSHALLVAGLVTLFAMLRLPYGAYKAVHLIVTLGSGYGAFRFYQSRKSMLCIAAGVAAIIFNPIIPLHLTRALWGSLDVFVGIGLLILAWLSKDMLSEKSA